MSTQNSMNLLLRKEDLVNHVIQQNYLINGEKIPKMEQEQHPQSDSDSFSNSDFSSNDSESSQFQLNNQLSDVEKHENNIQLKDQKQKKPPASKQPRQATSITTNGKKIPNSERKKQPRKVDKKKENFLINQQQDEENNYNQNSIDDDNGSSISSVSLSPSKKSDSADDSSFSVKNEMQKKKSAMEKMEGKQNLGLQQIYQKIGKKNPDLKSMKSHKGLIAGSQFASNPNEDFEKSLKKYKKMSKYALSKQKLQEYQKKQEKQANQEQNDDSDENSLPQQNHQDQKGYQKYSELVHSLNYLHNMNWLSQSQTSSKYIIVSPFQYLTPVCFWFWVCAQYFPKRLLFLKSPKEAVNEVKHQIDYSVSDVQMRLNRHFVKTQSNNINTGINNSMDNGNNHSSNKIQDQEIIKSIKSEFVENTSFAQKNMFPITYKINEIQKKHYTMEDDMYILKLRKQLLNIGEKYSEKFSKIAVQEKMNIIKQMDFETLIQIYQSQYNQIQEENLRQLHDLIPKMEPIFEQELQLYNPKDHDLDDMLVDLTLVTETDKDYIHFLETKQQNIHNDVPSQLSQSFNSQSHHTHGFNPESRNFNHSNVEENENQNKFNQQEEEQIKQEKIQEKVEEFNENGILEEKQRARQPQRVFVTNNVQTIPSNVPHVQNQVKVMEDYVCQICNDGDYSDDDNIVFCSQCNITVHQKCFGIVKIPNEDWMCDSCQAFGPNSKYLRCLLCSMRGGAMKPSKIPTNSAFLQQFNGEYHEFGQTCRKVVDKNQKDLYVQQQNIQQEESLYFDWQIQGNAQTYTKQEVEKQPKPLWVWVHMTCALWIPQVYFEQQNTYTGIRGIENIDQKRFGLVCSVCQQKQNGACIQCAQGKCQIAFHPECARRANLCMEMRVVDRMQYLMFCQRHTPLKIKRLLEQKQKQYKDEITKFCKAIEQFHEAVNQERDQTKEKLNVKPASHPNQHTVSNSQKIGGIKTKKEIREKQRENRLFLKALYDQYSLRYDPKFTITVQKVYENEDQTQDIVELKQYKILQISQPQGGKSYLNLEKYDQIWSNMSFMNQTPIQLFQRYRNFLRNNQKELKRVFEQSDSQQTPVQITSNIQNNIGNIGGGNMSQLGLHHFFGNNNSQNSSVSQSKPAFKDSTGRDDKQNIQNQLEKFYKQKQHYEKRLEQEKKNSANNIIYGEYEIDQAENHLIGGHQHQLISIAKNDQKEDIIIEDDNKLYCICRKQYQEGQLMLECQKCQDWFHFQCIGYKSTEDDAAKLQFYCPLCQAASVDQNEINERKLQNESYFDMQFFENLIIKAKNNQLKACKPPPQPKPKEKVISQMKSSRRSTGQNAESSKLSSDSQFGYSKKSYKRQDRKSSNTSQRCEAQELIDQAPANLSTSETNKIQNQSNSMAASNNNLSNIGELPNNDNSNHSVNSSKLLTSNNLNNVDSFTGTMGVEVTVNSTVKDSQNSEFNGQITGSVGYQASRLVNNSEQREPVSGEQDLEKLPKKQIKYDQQEQEQTIKKQKMKILDSPINQTNNLFSTEFNLGGTSVDNQTNNIQYEGAITLSQQQRISNSSQNSQSERIKQKQTDLLSYLKKKQSNKSNNISSQKSDQENGDIQIEQK